VNYTQFDGATTNFSAGSSNLTQPVLENTTTGKIVWSGSGLNFSNTDFDQYVQIGQGYISVDSANLPVDVNTSAQLTLYDVEGLVNPKIFVDGKLCTDCGNFSYNGTDAVFDVVHFTNYTVQNITGCLELSVPGEYNLTQDIPSFSDVCFNITASNVTLDGMGHEVVGNRSLTFPRTFIGSAVSNLTVRNLSMNRDAGSIGGDNGKFLTFDTCSNMLFENVTIREHSGANGYIGSFVGCNNVVFDKISGFDWSEVGFPPGYAGAGLYFESGSDFAIRNSNFYSNYGWYTFADTRFITGFTVENNTAGSSTCEVYVFGFIGSNVGEYSNNMTIRNNNFSTCVRVMGSYTWSHILNDMVVVNNTFGRFDSGNCVFTNLVAYNNYFDVSPTFTAPNGNGFTWNTSRQVGTRPYNMTGTEIGGNRYGSECFDANIDGFCDFPFSIGNGDYDYLAIRDIRLLFNGSPNVYAPIANQSSRGLLLNMTLGSRDLHERINVLVDGVNVIANDTNTTSLGFIVNVTSGDVNISIESDDVNGTGNMSSVTIPIKVSNLGVVSGVATDKSVYWTVQEQPVVSFNVTSFDGYVTPTVRIDAMNGSTVIASQNVTDTVNLSQVHNFTQSIVQSYENATFMVEMNDTLYVENATASGIVLDALTQPVVLLPNTVKKHPFNVTWSATTQNLGNVSYALGVSYDNGSSWSSVVSGVSASPYLFTPVVESTQTRFRVNASDSYVTTDQGVGPMFTINMSPEMTDEICVALTYPNEDDLPAAAKVPVNFSVYAPFGFSSPVVMVKLKSGGTVANGSCAYVQVDNKTREYNCNVSMRYFYPADSYDLNITYADGNHSVAVYDSNQCTYGQLMASQRSVSSVVFPGASPGVSNVVSDKAVGMRNTGNVQFDLSVLSYDLIGGQNPVVLAASNFKVGENLGSAVQMQNAVEKNLSVSLSPAENATADLWLWLSMPNSQQMQDYTAATPWHVIATG
jgi:hypothetical protein